jgi:hypothetical protein
VTTTTHTRFVGDAGFARPMGPRPVPAMSADFAPDCFALNATKPKRADIAHIDRTSEFVFITNGRPDMQALATEMQRRSAMT